MNATEKNLVKTSEITISHQLKPVRKFSKEYQPSPKAKSEGWDKLRAKKLLSKEILKYLFDSKGNPKPSFVEFVRCMVENAQNGNPKAMDIICKAIEDSDTKMGNSEQIIVIQPVE